MVAGFGQFLPPARRDGTTTTTMYLIVLDVKELLSNFHSNLHMIKVKKTYNMYTDQSHV